MVIGGNVKQPDKMKRSIKLGFGGIIFFSLSLIILGYQLSTNQFSSPILIQLLFAIIGFVFLFFAIIEVRIENKVRQWNENEK